MLDVARSFNRYDRPRPIDMAWLYDEEESDTDLCGYKPTGRPGDDFASKVTWAETWPARLDAFTSVGWRGVLETARKI